MATSHKLQTEHVQRNRKRGAWHIAPLGAMAIALAVGGHLATAQRNHVSGGAILFGMALIAFLLPPFRAGAKALDRKQGDWEVAHSRPLIRRTMWRMAFLANAAILAGVAFWAFTGNRLDRGLWFWLIGLLYFLVAVVERPQAGWRRWATARFASLNWQTLAMVLAITGIAAFFRVYNLESTPVEMTSDHAEKLLDVYDVLNGHRAIYFTRNTGREALQFYLTAALIRWTPLEVGHLALKVGTAAFGIVTVPLTYLLGRELYGSRVGLLAAFLLAISHWHVTISRVGLRFPFTAAFAAPALFFLFRALRGNRRNDWLAAGAFLGIGLHTYTAMRVVPLLFLLLIASALGADVFRHLMRKRSRQGSQPAPPLTLTGRFWRNSAAGGSLSLLIFLPLLRYMLEYPESFWYRAASRAQKGSMALPEIWRLFWHNTKNALLMFNYRGDVVPVNTVPEAAVLGPVTGGLFVLGVCWVLWRLLFHGERRAGYVAMSLFVLLLPSILSLAFPGENPSVVRTGGAIPVVMILAAVPLVVVLDAMMEVRVRSGLQVAVLFILLLLGTATAFNYDWYFHHYDANVRRSLWNATEMGAALRAFEQRGGSLKNAYHVAYPHWVDTRNIAINAQDITWRNVVTDLSQIRDQAQHPGRKLYLVFPSHEAALKVLAEVYPDGRARLQPSERPGKSFYVFEVPAPGKTSMPLNLPQEVAQAGLLRPRLAIFRPLR